jgi:hypothetical protein
MVRTPSYASMYTIWIKSLCQTFGWSDCVSGLVQERAAGIRARSSVVTLVELGI